MSAKAEVSDWAERHLIQCVLGDLTAQDPYLAESIRLGIMAAWEAKPIQPGEDPGIRLVQALQELSGQWNEPQVGLECLDATRAMPRFSPLWLRTDALRLLRLMAPFPTAVLAVVNLRRAVRRSRQRWSGAAQRDYQEAIDLLRGLTLKTARPSARLHLLILS